MHCWAQCWANNWARWHFSNSRSDEINMMNSHRTHKAVREHSICSTSLNTHTCGPSHTHIKPFSLQYYLTQVTVEMSALEYQVTGERQSCRSGFKNTVRNNNFPTNLILAFMLLFCFACSRPVTRNGSRRETGETHVSTVTYCNTVPGNIHSVD